jgi:hypothetical protein
MGETGRDDDLSEKFVDGESPPGEREFFQPKKLLSFRCGDLGVLGAG